MLVQSVSYSTAYLNQREHFVMDRGPRKLKDCLQEDSNTCSSTGFRSFPRQPLQSCPVKTKRKSNMSTAKNKEGESLKSRSRTLQAVINAVKSLQFNAVTTAPSILPRSLSRRLSKKDDKRETVSKAQVTVRVKDIVEWRLSVDVNEYVCLPLEFKPSPQPSPPHHYETTTATVNTTAGSTTTTSSTRCSSWCDSDFPSEFSPSSGGNSEEYREKDIGTDREKIGKEELTCVGEEDAKEAMAATVTDTQAGPTELQCAEENDYCSPVSILHLQYEEDDEASDSFFSRSLDNVERTNQKLMQKIKRFESLANISPFDLDKWMTSEEDSCTEGGHEAHINADDSKEDDNDGVDYDGRDAQIEEEEQESDEFEEKVVQLWNQVKEGCEIWIQEEHLVMDFFREELSRRLKSHDGTLRDRAFENELVTQAKAWIQMEKVSDIEHGSVESWMKACVTDMEREDGKWKRVEEEREEVGIEVENALLHLLMDETLSDLYLC